MWIRSEHCFEYSEPQIYALSDVCCISGPLWMNSKTIAHAKGGSIDDRCSVCVTLGFRHGYLRYSGVYSFITPVLIKGAVTIS